LIFPAALPPFARAKVPAIAIVLTTATPDQTLVALFMSPPSRAIRFDPKRYRTSVTERLQADDVYFTLL
jgi:hypothetical protein